MMVLRVFVVNAAAFLLLAIQPLATAQVLDPHSKVGVAKSGSVVTAQVSEKAPADPSGVKQANWYTLPMPKITMPKIEMPRFSMPSFGASGGESSGDKRSIFEPLTTGAHKISDGSKKAWAGAKDMFRFGRGPTDQQPPKSASKNGPSLWERMFSPKEPEGPRTVAEWMAQPRLDP